MRSSPPGAQVKHLPRPIRRMPRCRVRRLRHVLAASGSAAGTRCRRRRAGRAGRRASEQRLLLAGRRRRPSSVSAQVQRLDAERVAGAEGPRSWRSQMTKANMPRSRGTHRLAPVVDSRATTTSPSPFGGERSRRARGQLLAQLEVVVDLAVEGQRYRPSAYGSGWWLCSTSMIDSRLKPNTARSSDHDAGLVRPAVVHAVLGVADGVDRGGVDAVGVGGEVGEQATHQAQVLGVGERWCVGRVRRARRRASSAWRCARRRRTGTGWCRRGS